MSKVNIEAFKIIGISVKTSNKDGQSAQDIGALWNRFMEERILDKIPNKIEETIFSIYTEYEGDHTQPYTTILGCKVAGTSVCPKGMVVKTFDGGNYLKYIAKGDLVKGVVYQEWSKIWAEDLVGTFVADFEVYGKKAQNPTDAEVEIFVGVK